MPATWNGNQLKKTVRQNAIAHLWRMCFFVEGIAKQLCPVDKNILRPSIHSVVNEIKMYGLVGTNVFYGIFQELGWTMRNGVFHKGRHYLQGGLDRLRQKKGNV